MIKNRVFRRKGKRKNGERERKRKEKAKQVGQEKIMGARERQT